MITGWITDHDTAHGIVAAVRDVFTAPVWEPQVLTVKQGEHAGAAFLPMSDGDAAQRIRGTTRLMDYPQFAELANRLGGLGARVSLPDHLFIPLETP